MAKQWLQPCLIMALHWVLLSVLTNCASNPRGDGDIRIGMDKDRVLEVAGNPKRIFRENSEDHWLYQYVKESKEWRREIVFIEGKVASVGKPVDQEDWVNELKSTTTMEEFEQKARAHQQKSQNFKSIDGEPPTK